MNIKDSFYYILQYYDKEVVKMISEKYGFSFKESLKRFLNSETYKMLYVRKISSRGNRKCL